MKFIVIILLNTLMLYEVHCIMIATSTNIIIAFYSHSTNNQVCNSSIAHAFFIVKLQQNEP